MHVPEQAVFARPVEQGQLCQCSDHGITLPWQGLASSHCMGLRTMRTPVLPYPQALRVFPIGKILLHPSSKWRLTSLEHKKPGLQADTSL